MKRLLRLFVVRNEDNLVDHVVAPTGAGDRRRYVEPRARDVPDGAARGQVAAQFHDRHAKFGRNTPEQTYEVVKVPKR